MTQIKFYLSTIDKVLSQGKWAITKVKSSFKSSGNKLVPCLHGDEGSDFDSPENRVPCPPNEIKGSVPSYGPGCRLGLPNSNPWQWWDRWWGLSREPSAVPAVEGHEAELGMETGKCEHHRYKIIGKHDSKCKQHTTVWTSVINGAWCGCCKWLIKHSIEISA